MCKILPGAVLLLGYFDGVHLGHRELIRRAAEISDGERKLAVWTFSSLPKGGTLTDNSEKLTLLHSCGVEHVIFADFEALRSMSGDVFFNTVIADGLKPYAVVCGENFRFGKNAAWDSVELKRLADSRGIRAMVLPHFESDGEPVSSTRIRALIQSGDTLSASKLLGRLYSVELPVIHGKKLGRTIGHPTINQIIPDGRIHPKNGVYGCIAEFTDKAGISYRKLGVCNIGSRPTVNSNENDITLETNILDYSGDLYGVSVKLSFAQRIRNEIRFDSIDKLREQIDIDTEYARKNLNRYL